MIRAIEAAESGDDLSHSKSEELVYDAAVFGLRMERSVLYERINRRVDIMLEQGLTEETRRLLAEGVPETAQSMQAIGYRQTVLYLRVNGIRLPPLTKLNRQRVILPKGSLHGTKKCRM